MLISVSLILYQHTDNVKALNGVDSFVREMKRNKTETLLRVQF